MATLVSHLPFSDWLTILLHFLHPIKVKAQTKRDSGTCYYGFPALTAVVAANSMRENEWEKCVCFKFPLVDWIVCVSSPLRLVIVLGSLHDLITWSTFGKHENNSLLKTFVSRSWKSILKLGNLFQPYISKVAITTAAESWKHLHEKNNFCHPVTLAL